MKNLTHTEMLHSSGGKLAPSCWMWWWLHIKGGQTCSMYEPHMVKPKLQRAATLKSKNTNLFAIYVSVT